jgi:GTP-binding protein
MSGRFVISETKPERLPVLDGPEFALIGRSNVGKSSLLECLMGTRDLVRVSKTPGRTQLLNMFVCDEKCVLVDLPGYGFAQRSKAERSAMYAMVKAYFAQRDSLRGVLLLLDARREEVTEDDKMMAQWISEHHRPILVVVTKIDLIPKTKRLHQVRLIEKSLGVPYGMAQLCSAATGEGKAALMNHLMEMA